MPVDPRQLPIQELRLSLAEAWRKGECSFLIHAPTGSGKSTQVPQMLLDERLADGQVIVLQPRRLAARMLAARVAWERSGRLGDEVGYQVRFDRVAGPNTRIHFVTEGVLLRQLLENHELRGVSAVVLDEFHERHLHGDISLARCRLLQKTTRPDLRLIVMSATLDAVGLEAYLQPCRVLTSEGRTFPVDIVHRPQGGREMPIWDKVARAAREAIIQESREGDVLIFLPGGHEIRKTIEALRFEKWAKDFAILPLHGELPPDQQDAAVAPSQRRKIVVATNVAETSVTIDGVRVVIDSGLARMANFDPKRGINTLTIEQISQASALQRAGRAGRTAPGLCLRLWSEADHQRRPSHERPEIHRLDLSETVLTLNRGGVKDLAAFPWFEPPDAEVLGRSTQLLADLDAIDMLGEITAIGRRMTDFPVPPRHARLLVESEGLGVEREACLLVALMQGRSIFAGSEAARESFAEPGDSSDFLPLMRAWNFASQQRYDLDACRQRGIHAGAAREVGRLVQLLGRKLRSTAQEGSLVTLADLLLVAFPDQVAARRGIGSKVFEVSGGRKGQLDRHSVIDGKANLIVASEITEIEAKETNVVLNLSTAVTEDDLRRRFPDDFHEECVAEWDSAGRRVIAEQRTRFRDLVLARRQSGDPPKDLAASILAERVLEDGLTLKNWDGSVEAWLARLRVLREAMPELELPEFTEMDRRLIVEEICQGSITYKQVKEAPVWPALREWLSHAHQAALDAYAPEQITLSNGTKARIDYLGSGGPSIAVVLQRLYDVNETPAIARGRLKLLVHILAPNQRPAQVTRDLKGFWSNSYPAVRAQLAGRYPRHEWR